LIINYLSLKLSEEFQNQYYTYPDISYFPTSVSSAPGVVR
jgi:hypothetical protein